MLLRVSPARLKSLVSADPQWTFRLAVLLAQKTRLLFFALEAIAKLDMQAKLARVIAMTITQGGTAVPDLDCSSSPLTQGSLAETLGMTHKAKPESKPRNRSSKLPLTTKSASRSDIKRGLKDHQHTTLIHSRAPQTRPSIPGQNSVGTGGQI